MTETEQTCYHCPQCGQDLPADAFHWVKAARYANGVRREAYCKSCAKERKREANRRAQAAWRERNPHGPTPDAPAPDGYLHWREAADLLGGVSRQWLHVLIQRGDIVAHTTRAGYVSAASVAAYKVQECA